MTGLSSSGETAVLAPLTTDHLRLAAYRRSRRHGRERSFGQRLCARQRRRGGFANAGNNPTVASNSAIVTFPAATGSLGHG